nr:MAG TPA: hypothetical protein [Caudoviricetes sp.]
MLRVLWIHCIITVKSFAYKLRLSTTRVFLFTSFD